MALDCRIIRTADGDVDYVNTEEGTRSALFDNLAKVSNKDVALDMYALTETDDFKSLRPVRRGEPTAQEVISYATQRNATLNDEQIRDVENTVMSSGLGTYGELLNELKGIFFKNGAIVFDRDSLQRSGFYNQYEVESIMGDLNLQNTVKRTIQGMLNTDSSTIPGYDPLFVVIQTSALNSLGKQVASNPYIVEQTVTEAIAGTNLEETIDSLPFEPIKNAYYKDPTSRAKLNVIAQTSRAIAQKQIVEGALVDKLSNQTRETLEEVLDLENRQVVTSKINYLTSMSDVVWDSSRDAIYTLLKDLNKTSIQAGVDLLNIEDTAFTKERSEILPLLATYSAVLNQPSDETLDAFTTEYNDFFQINTEPATKVVTTTDVNDIYLETDLSEYQLFDQYGLVKKGENIYREVEVMDSLDDVYSTMVANITLLPQGVETEAQLREYIYNTMSDISDYEVDPDTLQKLALYKMYFRSPQTQRMMPDNMSRFLQFTGDYNYLTQEYPSDFYKQLLKEKKANSDLYKNFYKHFTVGARGIELTSSDPITVQNVMRYATEDLKQYNLLSKNLNLPVDELTEDQTDFNEMVYNRQQVIGNPEMVAKLNKDYTVLSPITIAVKNENTTFVRTPIGVYEIDYQIGNVSFYNLLPKGDSMYNGFGQYNTKTQPDLNVDDYTYLQDTPEVFTRVKNYYSAAELKRINNEYFNCL